jgi:hypothetical protein
LVYVVEDWETVEEHAGHGQGYYQVFPRGKGMEVRIKVGTLGYKKNFEDPKDPLLERIMKFCGSNDYVEVNENIWDEYFFK